MKKKRKLVKVEEPLKIGKVNPFDKFVKKIGKRQGMGKQQQRIIPMKVEAIPEQKDSM